MKWIAIAVFLLSYMIGYNLIDKFDPDSLKGKRVVVTGASTGIGEQLAYAYARLGADLLITARREKRLQEVVARCREIGNKDGNYHYITADMAKMDATPIVIQAAKELLGGIDFLVLNHITAAPLGEWHGTAENFTRLQNTLDVNFSAYVHLSSHALPLLGESQGSVVVVSSILGKMGQPFLAPYSSAKFALDGFFSSLRQELILRELDISITLCIIGLTGTESAIENLKSFGAEYLLDTLSIGRPSEAAYAIMRGGALREREIYYPYWEAKIATLLRDWIPNILEACNLYLYKQ